MSKFTWLGDGDPEAQDITQYGHVFVKGEPVNVTDKAVAAKLAANPMFSTDAKAEPAPVDEPTAEEMAARAEDGTEKGAIKARLREKGVTIQGNPSLETLRQKLADTIKGQAE